MMSTFTRPGDFWRLRILLPVAAIVLFGSSAHAQTLPSATPQPIANPQNTNRDDGSRDYGSPENEMRAKLVIKEEKKRYEENLARAKEVSELAGQVAQSFRTLNSFSSDDAKKLERLEKLTKRIRNEAGGSDSEPDADVKDLGPDMPGTLKTMSEMADELQKLVEKTPRQVVSAAVIDQANKLMGLVEHVRGVRP
jgi:hypothetical protein